MENCDPRKATLHNKERSANFSIVIGLNGKPYNAYAIVLDIKSEHRRFYNTNELRIRREITCQTMDMRLDA